MNTLLRFASGCILLAVGASAYAAGTADTPVQTQDRVQQQKQIQQQIQEHKELNNGAQQQQQRIENQYEHQYKKYPDASKSQQNKIKQPGKGGGKQGGGKH